MGSIVLLDENMVNMIAAGEVIERPASVVKELLENSIDAGAKKIVVKVEDGGRKLISVTDDGCGMDGDDLAKAFEPHATSKLKSAADLLNISTMGFRGEAMASIGSVAEVGVVSRMRDAIEANKIEVDCSRKSAVKPASGDYGTTIEVRNLFYKLPGRRKFLRTANTEVSHITEHFCRIALANPDLQMSLFHNDRQVHHLSAGQTAGGRIAQLFSNQRPSLIEINSQEKDLGISGFLGDPENSRANTKMQYVFLNGRYIRDRFISHAIKEAYRGLIEPDRFGAVFLFLSLKPSAFDVNVHPTKIEVRFDNSNLIHSQVLGVLREKLLSLNLDVKGQLTTGQNFGAENDPVRKQQITDAMSEFFRQNKPIRTQQSFNFADVRHKSDTAAARGRETFYSEAGSSASENKRFLQVHDSFIVAETDDGFVIIDQHALHERIIYENLCRKIASDKAETLESQKLLIPESMEVTGAEREILSENSEILAKLGIEIEQFGPNAVAIGAFPSLLSKVKPADFLRDFLDLVSAKNVTPDAERLLHEVLDMTACKAAIKAGQRLSQGEMEQLLADKDGVQRASRCPHGRPTTITFSLDELTKQFKRT